LLKSWAIRHSQDAHRFQLLRRVRLFLQLLQAAFGHHLLGDVAGDGGDEWK
jgi:hypothetical protein